MSDPAGGVGDPHLLTARFLRWWSERNQSGGIWPTFDQLVREMLLDAVGAKRVRLYHVVEGGQALRGLSDESSSTDNLSAPTGLMAHVISVGRRYVRGDWSHGPLVEQLASESEEAVASASPESAGAPAGHPSSLSIARGPATWMFPIRDHEAGASSRHDGPSHRTIGLVVVGELDEPHLAHHDLLEPIADLVTEFWLHVRDYECLQIVRRTDRGSGVLNRTDFLRMGESALAEARREGEPVALLAVALEGLRRFDDEGQWTLRDRVIQEAGRILRRKLRNGDLVGRFSDDRFVILMRWLDLSLGRLIGLRVIGWVQEAIGEAVRSISNDLQGTETTGRGASPAIESSGHIVRVRCGLACDYRVDVPGPSDPLTWDGGGPGTVTRLARLSELLRGALSASAEARRGDEDMCVADLRPGAGLTSATSTESRTVETVS